MITVLIQVSQNHNKILVDIGKCAVEVTWKDRGTRSTKTILENKNNVELITLPELRLLIQLCVLLLQPHKSWYETENPDRDLHKYSSLIFLLWLHFLTALLRYSSYSRQSFHLKCTIQWLLRYIIKFLKL